MHTFVRTILSTIPFFGAYRLVRVSDLARLQENNRLLAEAGTETARKLQQRDAEFVEFATESALKFQEQQAHNHLLTEAATESARKLQQREAEFAEFATVSGIKFQELQEHNRTLTEAATESARKLQEREAELTNAINVMLRRLTRLSEHNRWLAETIDSATTTEPALLSGAVIQRLQDIEESIQTLMTGQNALKEAPPQVDSGRLQCPTPMSIRIDNATAIHPVLLGRDFQSRYVARRNRVLMVAPGLARGGAERQILATAEGLLQRGYEVEIFYFTDVVSEPDFISEFSQLSIECHNPFEFRNSFGGANIEEFDGLCEFAELVDQLDVVPLGRALARAIKEFRPEVVHCWSDLANVIGGLIGSNLGVPKVVLGQRNVPAFRFVDGVAPYVCRDAYRLLAQNPNVLMINNSLAGLTKYMHWLDVPHHKIRLIYNGFLPRAIHVRRGSEAKLCRRRLGLTDDTRVIGTVMRFAPEKDPLLWLEMAAVIAAALPDTRFVLAGYGNLAKQVEQKIESLGLTERFVLPGPVKDVGSIYAALDVLVLTSRFEGTPNVLIEAQAAGLPVVAPDVGGTSEALLDGVTGILVRNRQASCLARAVLEILGDPSWAERSATEGPAFVSKKFGHQRMIDETIAAYGLPAMCQSHDASVANRNGEWRAALAVR